MTRRLAKRIKLLPHHTGYPQPPGVRDSDTLLVTFGVPYSCGSLS